MFFTILISAYNCQKTINRLLDSIVNQDMNDFKVIICDDSDKEHLDLYENYISSYIEKISLNYYRREKEPYTVHCPGNTRHSALNKALQEDTQYILFIDCDDEFYENTLQTLKQKIIDYEYPVVLGTSFNACNENNQLLWIEENNLGWLHGKCFKKDFLLKYNIQFKIDLLTHEDTYFNCYINCILINNEITDISLGQDFIFYKWYYRNDSASHKELNDTQTLYLEKHFNDYCTAAIDTILSYVEKIQPSSFKVCQQLFTRGCYNFALAYCYFQGFLTNGKILLFKDNYKYYKQRLFKFLKSFNATKEDIIKIIYTNPQVLIQNRQASYKGVGFYVEQKSFKDFINDINFYE